MNSEKKIQLNPKPFLRWAGGKTWLTKSLYSFLPSKFKDYHEPFLGGGATFFSLRSVNANTKRKFYLSDLNESLINAYDVIKDNLQELNSRLIEFSNTEDEYYRIRSLEHENNIDKAAQFIFLNRTSFNGIYRENTKGIYNVPYGHKTYKQLFDTNNLEIVSQVLKSAELKNLDFEEAIQNVKKGDLVFLDPPYTVMHNNNGFVKYNQKIFEWKDQIRLHECIKEIKNKKAFFILTNANHESILDLYSDFKSKLVLERPSVIGGNNSVRATTTELLITNVH